MGGNRFARKSNFCNSAQNVTFRLLAVEIKESKGMNVPVRMKNKVKIQNLFWEEELLELGKTCPSGEMDLPDRSYFSRHLKTYV